MTADETSARAHYRTVAGAVAFVGAVGLAVAGFARLSSMELGFIDPTAMAGFSLLYLATAAAMTRRK